MSAPSIKKKKKGERERALANARRWTAKQLSAASNYALLSSIHSKWEWPCKVGCSPSSALKSTGRRDKGGSNAGNTGGGVRSRGSSHVFVFNWPGHPVVFAFVPMPGIMIRGFSLVFRLQSCWIYIKMDFV